LKKKPWRISLAQGSAASVATDSNCREASLLSTYASYQMITRDIGASIKRVEAQPLVKRETENFLDKIGTIKSAKEFVDDKRLFDYAMKAFGLSDMAYAKAFMLKVLDEGVSDPNSFANKLADKRYADFARVFDFAANGDKATTYNLAVEGTRDNYIARATGSGTFPLTETARRETEYFNQNIGQVRSIDDLLADDRLYTYTLRAFRLESYAENKDLIRRALEGGIEDPDSLANRNSDENFARMVRAMNFADLGEKTTTHIPARDETVSKYMRQTLEQDAGTQNEGVRLALYFERKAPNIKSFYEVLADPALAEVVRTVLSLPPSSAQMDIDKQAQTFEKRLDIEDFQDPERLSKLMTRFAAMWEINNPTSPPASAALALVAPPGQLGISVDTMMALAKLRR
jgi:hypothetical protein